MSSIASKWTDMHVCPMVTPGVPPIPHVGGPVTGPVPPVPPVIAMGGIPSRMGDMAVCVGPPDSLLKGSATVLVGKKPWVRLGIDPTAHGGTVAGPGCPTIIVGG